MNRKAFTLIELLVVIAIIAILAAILFPVFAQAKAAAKSAADLSNVKQLALANVMYGGDSDDVLPLGLNHAWNATWASLSEPYIKNGNVTSTTFGGSGKNNIGASVYRSPLDSNFSLVDWSDGSEGVAISYGANGAFIQSADTGWQGKVIGLFGNDLANTGNVDEVAASKSLTQATQPASTIMLADKFNSDARKYGSAGVFSAFCGNLFTNLDWADWCAPGEIPNGNAKASYPWNMNNGTAYPRTSAGAVGIHSGNKSNFAFADGHVKALTPAATNPDPVNRPADNMWDSIR